MEKIEQKPQQENFLGGEIVIQSTTSARSEENTPKTEEPVKPETVQFVLPQEALNRINELERQYRETVERENK